MLEEYRSIFIVLEGDDRRTLIDNNNIHNKKSIHKSLCSGSKIVMNYNYNL